MPAPSTFYFTSHGTQRAGQRAISVEQFKTCVIYPEAKRQVRRGTHGGFVYHFTKEIETKRLHVFAELLKDSCWIVTGYWE